MEGTLDLGETRRLSESFLDEWHKNSIAGGTRLGRRGWAKTFQENAEHEQRLGAVLSPEGGSGDGERPLLLMELRAQSSRGK